MRKADRLTKLDVKLTNKEIFIHEMNGIKKNYLVY